jgi:carboxypeptidase T
MSFNPSTGRRALLRRGFNTTANSASKWTIAAAAAALFSATAGAHSPTPQVGNAKPSRAELHQQLEQEKAVDNIYKAHFPSRELGRKAAISLHAQLLESNWKDGYLIVELDTEELERLRGFGFRLERAAEFIERRNQRLTMLQIMQASRSSADAEPLSIPGYTCYETVEETFTVADGLIASKPALGGWADAGDSWLKTQGAGGYDIRVLKLTNSAIAPPAGSSKPKLFVNSAIHAREYTTAPLMLEFARWLVNGHGVNADATWILDHHEVHLMLHANPDGRKRAETGLSWRKNVNNNYCANTNTRGVDLNRNFTYQWNSTGGQGSSGSQCNLTYRGPSAGSEPEIQAIESYVRSLWPDRRGPGLNDAAPADTSGIHLDVHSFSQLVLWPWGTTSNPAPNGPALQTLGRKFAFFNGYEPTQSIGLYPTDGTSDGISYGELGVAAFTFELGTSFFESCTNFQNTIKPANLPALIYAAKVVRTPYITPAGPDLTALSLGGTASSTGVVAGTVVPLVATVSDNRFSGVNGVESTQAVVAAQYSINVPPWEAGAPVLPLAAADGSFDAVTENVSGGINTAGLAPGQYIVYVRGQDASLAWGAVSAVFLNIVAPQIVAEVEPNNSFANAQPIASLPVQVNGNIGPRVGEVRDRDYYAVTVPAGRTLTATLTAGPESDYNVDIYDANQVLLARSSNGIGQVDTVNATNTSAAPVTLYVRVYFRRGLSGVLEGNYRLDLAQ